MYLQVRNSTSRSRVLYLNDCSNGAKHQNNQKYILILISSPMAFGIFYIFILLAYFMVREYLIRTS